MVKPAPASSVIDAPATLGFAPTVCRITGVAGAAVTTMMVFDCVEQPLAVTLTVYVPAVEAIEALEMIGFARVELKFWGPLQAYVAPARTGVLSWTVPPAQTGPSFVAAAARLVTTCVADVAEQPAGFVTVTVNEPVVETVIDCVVAPVDQRLPVAEDEVSVIGFPGQIVVGPLMVGVVAAGAGATTNGADVAEQPPAFVTVTV
jgi:hypothetical protein